MHVDLHSAIALLNNWQQFDPEKARAQRFLRAFVDHPYDEELRHEAEEVLDELPKSVQMHLARLVKTERREFD